MCDQTEVPYLAGDVVWVKLGPVWWPGRVCNNDEIPPEVFKELRKTPIAIVKFFQEDSFEYVKKLSNIYHYNCLKKNEFIKKGLDMCRSSNRDTPSNMKLFPEDIATAEVLTGGNPNIIHDEMFLPEKKPSYAADFAPTPKKTPKKLKVERKKEIPSPKTVTPRVITHPRFIRHGVCDYEARERQQVPLRAECDEEDNSPPTTYRCTECSFSTIRLNVLVLHNKSHVHNYASQHTTVKGVKRKSTSTIRFKEKRPAIERKSTDIVKPKTPKTPSEKPKTPQKKSPAGQQSQPEEVAPKVVEVRKPVLKKRRHQEKTDEFQNSLLEDWAEFENEQEVNEDSTVSEDFNESTASSSKTGKSCFDFDESEDDLVIDKSKIRAGRKIPRVLDEKDEDSNAFSEQSNSLDDQVSSSDGNRNGIDSVEEHEYAETRKTSQLQEMGVDNEIEIDSKDECEVDTTTIEDIPLPEPAKVIESDPVKEREAEELKQKVDKLLEEISTPSKLPDVPYSVKKAHIKSFNESEELARREAEKLQAAKLMKSDPPQPEVTEEVKPAEVKTSEVETVETVVTTQTNEPQPNSVEISESEVVEIAQTEPVEPVESKLSELAQPISETTTPEQVVIKAAAPTQNDTAPPQSTAPPANTEQNAKSIKILFSNAGHANQIVLPKATTANNTTPVKTIPTNQVKVVPPKFKIINKVASPTKVIGATTSASVTSAMVEVKPGQQSILNKLQSGDGKTFVSLQSPQKFIINKGKSIIIDTKQVLNTHSGQKIRLLGPNILQQTAGVKTPAKSITLPSNLTGSNVVVLQPQKSIVLTSTSSESSPTMNSTTPAAADTTTAEVTYISDSSAAAPAENYQAVSSAPANSVAQVITVDFNQTNNLYITDQSGNLIISDGTVANNTQPKEDILAKALENTDVLQADITLTDVSQSVLDTISVAQNTPITFKNEAVFDTNLTLKTPPIMSSFETPSRALNPAAVLAEAVSNEMIILNDNTDPNDFVS